MPPSTAQLAEITRLDARLSTARTSRASLILSLDRLRTRHSNEYAKLLSFRNQLDQKKREADFAHSNSQLRDYRLKLDEMHDIGQQSAFAFREYRDLDGQIHLATRQIGVLEGEISELERVLSALRAGGH